MTTINTVVLSLCLAAGSFVGGMAYGINVERKIENCYQRGMELAQELGEGEVLKRLGKVNYYQTFQETVREKCWDDSNYRWR